MLFANRAAPVRRSFDETKRPRSASASRTASLSSSTSFTTALRERMDSAFAKPLAPARKGNQEKRKTVLPEGTFNLRLCACTKFSRYVQPAGYPVFIGRKADNQSRLTQLPFRPTSAIHNTPWHYPLGVGQNLHLRFKRAHTHLLYSKSCLLRPSAWCVPLSLSSTISYIPCMFMYCRKGLLTESTSLR